MDRGKQQSGMAYRAEDWKARGIRKKRFRPCPHCGSAVVGKERIWTPPYSGAPQAVFREAHCMNEACGWRYFKHEGTREEFIAETNRRIDDDQGER